MQLLNLLAESECQRTHIQAASHLLLLRIRHKEVASLMPSLPKSLLSRKGKKQVVQVQYEFLLMLISEKDLEKEVREAESVTKELLSGKDAVNADNIKNIISLRGRYLRNRLQRGLDINLSKIPLLHNCKYLRREAHWFMPFDKTHPLFQSVMIDEKGNEKRHLSTMVDFILDCDIDKMATLYLVSHDNDFSRAIKQLDEQELPNMENAVIPEYTFRFVMQDLFRFFGHSPLHSQLINPFRDNVTLFDFRRITSGGLFGTLLDITGPASLGFDILTCREVRLDAFLFGEQGVRFIATTDEPKEDFFLQKLTEARVICCFLGRATKGRILVDGMDFGSVNRYGRQ
jgi:hypothetical protein